MNNITVMLGIMWILMALSGVAAYTSAMTIKAYLDLRRRRLLYPSVVRAVDLNLCKDGHAWNDIKLALSQLPVDKYKVCSKCGFVSGHKYQLNGPAMEVYRNTLKLQQETKLKLNEVFQRKQIETKEIMNRMIRNHVVELGTDLHKNIQVLESFFHKSNTELESLYSKLNKELDDSNKNG